MNFEAGEVAWHFLQVVDGVPVLRDGKTPAPPKGEWLTHEGPVVICESGLHASRTALQALNYLLWGGGVACLVEVDGVEGEHDDKFVCRRRRIIGMVDCDPILRQFARLQAQSVLHLWDAPPVVREYLETGDEAIRAAARAAASAAAGDAAWAAGAAARAAASAAAGDAAWAAGDAARAAARAAAGDAARAAAWAAAWAAAGDAAGDLLESLFLTEMGLS